MTHPPHEQTPPPDPTTPAVRPRLLIIAAMAGFALIGVLSRQAGAGALTVSFYRSLFVTLSFLAIYRARGGSLEALRPTWSDLRAHIGPYGVAVALASTTFVGGYLLTSYANTLFLHNLAPLFVLLLAWPFFGERARAAEIAGACVGIVGVACISGVSVAGFLTDADGRRLLGDGLALVSAVAYALVLIYTRRVRQAGLPLYGTLFWMWAVSTATLVVPTAVWGSFSLPLASLPWVLLLALLCTTLPFVLLNLGMAEVRAAEASVLAQSEVLFGLLLGFGLYGESLSALALTGGVLIVCGIAISQERAEDAADVSQGAAGGPGVAAPTAAAALSETPLLVALAVQVAMLDAQALSALLGGGAVALTAVGVMLTFGLSLLTSVAELRWRARPWSVGAVASLAAVGSLVSLGVCGVRAFQVPPEAAAGTGGALVALLASAAALLWMRGSLARAGHERAASRAAAASAVMGVAAAGEALVLVGFELARALAGGVVVLGVLLALEALGSATGALVPAGRLQALASRRWLSPRLLRWGGGALLAVYAGSGFFVVQPCQAAMAETLGEAGSVLGPGLHYALPWPFGRVEVVDTARSRVARIGTSAKGSPDTGLQASLMLTGDDNIADVQASVEYTVQSPERWLFGATDPEGFVQASAEAVLRELVAATATDALLVSARGALQESARTRLQLAVEPAGVRVLAFRVLSARPPEAVMDAFLEVVSAAEDRSTSVNQAYAYGASLLPEARGEEACQIAQAQAQARTSVARAQGEAARFLQMLAPYARAADVTAFRLYAETVEEGLRDVEKYVVDPGLTVQFRYKRTKPAATGSQTRKETP